MYNRTQDALIGKQVLNLVIRSTSPLLIGSGEENNSDKDFIRWINGDPYIPASSLTGVIRSWYESLYSINTDAFDELFWGSSNTKNDKTFQSHFVMDELLLIDSASQSFAIRDGVAIDVDSNTALDGSKYDYELREPGDAFQLNLEVTLRKGMDLKDGQEVLSKILGIMSHPLFRIGAHGSTGFGCIAIENIQFYQFDFSKQEDAEAWWKYLEGESPASQELTPKALTQDYFSLVGNFKIKSSLMIGTYPKDEKEPDVVHLSRMLKDKKKELLISGKSIKSAFRHRGQKILKILQNEEIGSFGNCDPKEFINGLFGYVNNEKKDEALKSRLVINETIVNDTAKLMRQDRIKIDRWTGGVIGGAKFDAEPVWSTDDECFQIECFIKDASEQEKFLLLQIMKDLFLEDLPIGGQKNIGRGVLVGDSLICTDANGKAVVRRPEIKSDALSIENPEYFKNIEASIYGK